MPTLNKLLSTIACAAVLATTASADFARVEMGAGMWNQSPSGTSTYDAGSGVNGIYISNEKDTSSTYAWMLVKHPIPIVPNIRLEYAKSSDEGIATGEFDGFKAPGGATAALDIVQYDIIPYYNILDNTFWTTIDLGLDIKVADVNYKADGVTLLGFNTSVGSYEDSSPLTLPMLYARTRIEIPVTNIGLEADAKYVTYSGSTAYDVRIKADYTLGFIPVVQPGLEVGYRMQKFDLKSNDDKTKVNLDFSGVYVGLMLRF